MSQMRCSGESFTMKNGQAWFTGCGRVFDDDGGTMECPWCGAIFCGDECCGNFSVTVQKCDLHLDCEAAERLAGKLLRHDKQTEVRS